MPDSYKQKRVGINLLFINPKLAGGSVTYAIKTIRELAALPTTYQYIIYINKDCVDIDFGVGENFTIRVLNFRYSSVYLRYFWEQAILPFYIAYDRIDLLHSLGYVTPLLTSAAKVVSILDINYKGHGANMHPLKKLLLGTTVNLSAKCAKNIITISEFSKRQIVQYTKTKPDKIIVTLLSGSTDVISGSSSDSNVLSKYGIAGDYIVAFSSTSTHKNIERLIIAFGKLAAERAGIILVLIGLRPGGGSAFEQLVEREGIKDRVVFTGFVPDEDISPLIAGAAVFAFPSLYEGFGIPLLDAQALSVPVVSSNAGSLPEVGGKAALYFDPTDIQQITDALNKVLDHPGLAAQLIAGGLVNRQQYSWKKTAVETLDVYDKYFASVAS